MDATKTPPPAAPQQKTLTPECVAAELDVTPEAVRDWLTYGVLVTTPKGERKRVALKGRKVGGRWRIERADLDTFTKVTTEASVSPDAVGAEDRAETAAQARRRAKGDQEYARAYLRGEK
ncbi:helix-turn-helix domain-containing protein [Gemmata sp.]|uniref:helix-turn-helix domain-containing protein n=1 Tax=Gemmata sp. TaxID=1914242 RepID=UPI003F6F2B51